MRALFVLAATASIANAQPSATAQAEALFDDGRRLLEAGKIPEACAAFEASDKIEAAISTKLNIAACHEKNGKSATAWAEFLGIEKATRDATGETAKAYHDAAADNATRLGALVSKLTIAVPDGNRVNGLAITRDGVAVDPVVFGHALPLDGGTYVIEATAPAMTSWKREVVLAAQGANEVVEIPKLAPPPTGSIRHVIVGVGGAVAIAAAIGLEISARSTWDDANQNIGTAAQNEKWQSANHQRYAAETFAVLGAGAIGVAIWLYLGDREQPESGVAIVPNARGLDLVGHF